MVATLGALVKDLGGSAVITLDQLNEIDPERIEIVKNDHPEGVRIYLKDLLA